MVQLKVLRTSEVQLSFKLYNETHRGIIFLKLKVYIYLEGIMAKKPVMLMILDGFGIAPAGDGNAVAAANKPNYDKLVANYPHSQLQASGMFVGLPDGQMGNSEVGHLNIGAGRIIYQELTRITKEINEVDSLKMKHY